MAEKEERIFIGFINPEYNDCPVPYGQCNSICDNFNLDEDYYVYCYTCGNKTNIYKFKQQAISAWNRRNVKQNG